MSRASIHLVAKHKPGGCQQELHTNLEREEVGVKLCLRKFGIESRWEMHNILIHQASESIRPNIWVIPTPVSHPPWWCHSWPGSAFASRFPCMNQAFWITSSRHQRKQKPQVQFFSMTHTKNPSKCCFFHASFQHRYSCSISKTGFLVSTRFPSCCAVHTSGIASKVSAVNWMKPSQMRGTVVTLVGVIWYRYV